jgi:hypothetical protein
MKNNWNIFFCVPIEVFSIGDSANILEAFKFLLHSTMNIKSDRCSSFPDWLFQVLNVVGRNIIDVFLHMCPKIKLKGHWIGLAEESNGPKPSGPDISGFIFL